MNEKFQKFFPESKKAKRTSAPKLSSCLCSGSCQTRSSIIYQPGGRRDNSVVTFKWSSVERFVKCNKGLITVYFDPTYQNPILLSPSIAHCGGSSSVVFDGESRVVFSPAFPVIKITSDSESEPESSLSLTGPKKKYSKNLKNLVQPKTKTESVSSKEKETKPKKKGQQEDQKEECDLLAIKSWKRERKSKNSFSSSSFLGSSFSPSPFQVHVLVYDKFTIQNLRAIQEPIVFIGFSTTTDNFRWTNSGSFFQLAIGAKIANDPSATRPLISIPPNFTFGLFLNDGGSLDNSNNPSVSIVNIEANAIVEIFGQFTGQPGVATFSGNPTASLIFAHDSSCQHLNQPGVAMQEEDLADQATSVGYDDYLVPFPLVLNPPPYGATVQLAIDALKQRVQELETNETITGTWTLNPSSSIVGVTVYASESTYSILNSTIVSLLSNFVVSYPFGPLLNVISFSFSLPATSTTPATVGVGLVNGETAATGAGFVGSAAATVGGTTATVTFRNSTLLQGDTMSVQLSLTYQLM